MAKESRVRVGVGDDRPEWTRKDKEDKKDRSRQSKPGRPRGFGPDMAEGKAIREGVIKKMGRVFRPGKAREADAAEAREAAFTEATEAVEASPPVEEAVAGEAEAPAEPSMTPTAKLRDPIKTLDDGSIEYQPKGDPYKYRKSPEGVYTVIDPATGEVVMTSSPGEDSYANFEAHFKGQETEFTRSPYSDEEIDAFEFTSPFEIPRSDEEIDTVKFTPPFDIPRSDEEIASVKFKPADEVLASDEIDDIEFAPPAPRASPTEDAARKALEAHRGAERWREKREAEQRPESYSTTKFQGF